jgi:hypothetical protein
VYTSIFVCVVWFGKENNINILDEFQLALHSYKWIRFSCILNCIRFGSFGSSRVHNDYLSDGACPGRSLYICPCPLRSAVEVGHLIHDLNNSMWRRCDLVHQCQLLVLLLLAERHWPCPDSHIAIQVCCRGLYRRRLRLFVSNISFCGYHVRITNASGKKSTLVIIYSYVLHRSNHTSSLKFMLENHIKSFMSHEPPHKKQEHDHSTNMPLVERNRSAWQILCARNVFLNSFYFSGYMHHFHSFICSCIFLSTNIFDWSSKLHSWNMCV